MVAVNTKSRILDSAEELFAQQGFGETSLREITRAAGVNLAAVNYHFGSKEALAQAVVGRLVAPINQERLRLLDELEATQKPPLVKNIVEAFVTPAAQCAGSTSTKTRIRLLGHIMTGPEPIREAVVQNFEVVARRFVAALGRAVPALSPEELIIRWRIFVASFRSIMMPTPMIKEHAKVFKGRTDTVLEYFITYAVAGLLAPARTETKTGAKE